MRESVSPLSSLQIGIHRSSGSPPWLTSNGRLGLVDDMSSVWERVDQRLQTRCPPICRNHLPHRKRVEDYPQLVRSPAQARTLVRSRVPPRGQSHCSGKLEGWYLKAVGLKRLPLLGNYRGLAGLWRSRTERSHPR